MKKATKIILGVATSAALAVAALTPVIVRAWGDNSATKKRPVYTLDQINHGALGEKITFNSIIDSPPIGGDERNFVGALPSQGLKATGNVWKADEINVEDGQTYTIRAYVHNNAGYANTGEKSVARNVKAYFSLPTAVGKSLTAIGYIEASNADPTKYWDEVTFKSNDNFYMEYVKGSATYTNHNHSKTFNLPDSIILGANTNSGNGGALLGYNQMDGVIPGCYEYDGEVRIQVKVHKSVTALVQKKVRIKGTKEWSEAVNAKVGDEVEYQIEYVNLLNQQVDNVMIRDILPTNVEYVPGSTVLYNSNYQNGFKVNQDTVTTSGINIGTHGIKGNSYVRFTGKVVDKNLSCGSNQLVNWANSTVAGAVVGKDDASVMVNKACEEPKYQASLDKKVRIKGTEEWLDNVTANVGDEIEYRVEYKNLSNVALNNVVIQDALPENVSYVPGSTMLYNASNPNGTKAADTLTTSGINVGTIAVNGNAFVIFTGKVVDSNLTCGANKLVNWANSAIDKATLKDDASVTVNKECQPDAEYAAKLDKKVRIKGTEEWLESVDAKVGDEVEYRIDYTNESNVAIDNVVIRDNLPKNVEYVAGSTMLYSGEEEGKAVKEDTITTSGINIGKHEPEASSYVTFTGKVVSNSLTCGTNELINWASTTLADNSLVKDDAKVMVEKDCEPDEPVPETPTVDSEEPTPTQTPAGTPSTIVSTGPAAVVTSAIGAGSTVTSLGYYLASRKKLI